MLNRSLSSSQSFTASTEFSSHSSPITTESYTNDHQTSLDAQHQIVCMHSLSDSQITIRHLIAKTTEVTAANSSSSAEHPHDVEAASSIHFSISSRNSAVSMEPSAPWNASTQSHEDFEMPPFLYEVLLQQGFKVDKPIGSGTYGKVYLATFEGSSTANTSWQAGQKYAVKVMDKQRLSVQYKSKFLRRELKALLSLEPHENIVRFYDIFSVSSLVGEQKEHGKLIVTIMGYSSNGDMYEYIQKRPCIPEPLARRWFVQLLAAVGHLHEHSIAHRDLKPENLLLDEDFNLKVTDFGFSLNIKTGCDKCRVAGEGGRIGLEKRSFTFCGSQSYCSVELLLAEPYCASLNDVWACGVILYVWLFNLYPIDGRLLENMEQFEFSMIGYPEKPHITPHCRLVMECIFQPEEMRYTVAQLRQLQWISQYNEEDLLEMVRREGWDHIDLPRQVTRSFERHASSSSEQF